MGVKHVLPLPNFVGASKLHYSSNIYSAEYLQMELCAPIQFGSIQHVLFVILWSDVRLNFRLELDLLQQSRHRNIKGH